MAGGYPHPGFNDKNVNRKDDIALVRLANRVQLSGKNILVSFNINATSQVVRIKHQYTAGTGITGVD